MGITARATGIGHLQLVKLDRNAKGELGDQAILRLESAVNGIITLLNGKLRVGDASPNSQTGNLDGICLRVASFPTAPNTEIAMPHSLRRPPVAAIPIFIDRACIVYSLRGAAELWGDADVAYMACNVADAKVILLLL